MRIIAGKHKGRKLSDFKKLRNLRPTTDKNRESLFNILSLATFLKEIDFDLTECNLLDVFSGTGSVGFEALSRGVKSVTFIDKEYQHIELSKKNSEILKEEKNCQFINFDLSKPIFRSNQKYNLIYVDPPYNEGLVEIAIQNLIKADFVQENALIIVETSVYEKIDLDKLKNLKVLVQKEYSKSILSFLVLKS